MKKYCILLAIAALILTGPSLLGQGPPPPPVGPESGGGPVGGPAPVGSGTLVLLGLGGIYAGYKSRKVIRESVG